MIEPGTLDSALMALVQAIAADDTANALRLLNVLPALASARFNEGATRHTAKEHYLDEIERYIYAGDTALHMAAAAYRTEIVQKLIAMGADVRARNRRGAEPLHAAAVGDARLARVEPARTSGDHRLSHRSGRPSKFRRQRRGGAVAPSGAHALRRSRQSPP